MENTPKAKDGLPAEVSINFDVLGNPVNLNLSRNQKVEKSKNMYVIRKSEQGIPVVVGETLTTNEVCTQCIHLSRLMTNLAKWHMRRAKTQISLDIRQSDQSLRCPDEESMGA